MANTSGCAALLERSGGPIGSVARSQRQRRSGPALASRVETVAAPCTAVADVSRALATDGPAGVVALAMDGPAGVVAYASASCHENGPTICGRSPRPH